MARKPVTAPAERSDAPHAALSVTSRARDGVHFPAVTIKGAAPRKGSTIRVKLENGVTYSAKVLGTSGADGGTLVETEGLTQVAE